MNKSHNTFRGLVGFVFGIIVLLSLGATYKTVVAPTTSTDNAIPRFHGANGTYIQNSGVIINDTNGVSGIADLSIDGTFTSDSFATDLFTVVSNITYTLVELQPHLTVTNYVLDPTVAPYQIVNSTNLVTKFLHATNISAGRQCLFFISSGTNASVSVELPSNVKVANTNKVSMGPNQILSIHLYGYGANNTNALLIMGQVGI